MRSYSIIHHLLIISLVFLSFNVFAAPPNKVKPKVRTGRDIVVLDGAWQTRKDGSDRGVTGGWQNEVPKEAAQTFVPSLEDAAPNDTGKTAVWYWKRFDVAEKWSGQTLRLRFGAVAEDAQVWLNGQKLGEHSGGVTPFEFTVTTHAHIGGSNLLALRVVGGKWGTGIWQGVLLLAHDEAYLGDVMPQADAMGRVNATLDLWNTSKVEGDATLDASIVAAKSPERALQKTHQNLHVTPGRNTTTVLATLGNKQRQNWSPETPILYLLQFGFRQDKDLLDTTEVAFGFREWGYKDGTVTLNGSPIILKSLVPALSRPPVIVGADDREKLRASLHRLKAGGVTVLYTQAPPPALLQAADEEGLLIVEGARTGQTAQSASDEIRALIVRDRAHPCIFAWNLADADSDTIAAVRTLDPNRFMLIGMGATAQLWPPNQNQPVATMPTGLLP